MVAEDEEMQVRKTDKRKNSISDEDNIFSLLPPPYKNLLLSPAALTKTVAVCFY